MANIVSILSQVDSSLRKVELRVVVYHNWLNFMLSQLDRTPEILESRLSPLRQLRGLAEARGYTEVDNCFFSWYQGPDAIATELISRSNMFLEALCKDMMNPGSV